MLYTLCVLFSIVLSSLQALHNCSTLFPFSTFARRWMTGRGLPWGDVCDHATGAGWYWAVLNGRCPLGWVLRMWHGGAI